MRSWATRSTHPDGSARELPIGLYIDHALDLVRDRKEAVKLWADSGHARFKGTKRRAEAAVAGDLLEKVGDSADVELLRQEVRRARVEMEVEAVLVVGMRVLEIVGHPDDRRELKFVRGIEIGVADAASFGGS